MGHRVPNAACRPDARPRPRTQERRQGIGGKPTNSTPRNEVCFVSRSVTSLNRAAEGRASELLRHISIVFVQ